MDAIDEAEIRVMTAEMFKAGGADNVLACVQEMMRVERVILRKLYEILLEQEKDNAKRFES